MRLYFTAKDQVEVKLMCQFVEFMLNAIVIFQNLEFYVEMHFKLWLLTLLNFWYTSRKKIKVSLNQYIMFQHQ